MMTALLVAAILIIVVLAAVAAWLWHRVYRQSRRNRQMEREYQQRASDQRERINDSIRILARAVGNDEVTLTEASIRIRVLLDSLEADEAVREEFAAFYQLADDTAHIPILDQWKQLSPRDQHRFHREREQIEARHYDAVQDAAKRIQGRTF